MNPVQQVQAAGFDLSLVDESLRLAPEQRLLQHQAALEMVLALDPLIRTKEAVGRPKDLLAATELRAIAAKHR